MRKFPFLHLILFLLTFLSTLAVGALNAGVNIFDDPGMIYKGLPFSATLLVILLAHEFSHFLSSRRHHIHATLPYFIPAPTLFGTLGAFIKMKSPIQTKNALMDIGASGPIAGFLVSLVATTVGLFFSKVVPVTKTAGMISLGDSLLFSGLTRLILGEVPANYDVLLHPVAFAGWIGFFVTALNLIPVGQLDGGHILYALIGERHAKLSKVLIGVMIVLGLAVWEGWLVWAMLLVILGFRHPPIIYADVPLDSRRRLIGWAAVIIFILTFIPVPITIVGELG
ncbi:MAG: site-2 protease family protein [Nitrospiraceae bacterium]|nr:site-2 protease family protein [Nitrospiraceae bacterium]